MTDIHNHISAQQLAKTYGRITALRSISFELDGTGPFGIVGPDGAGKTTLMRILTGILTFDGKLNVLDFEYPREIEKAKTVIGYMPQSFGLYRDLSVKENLEFYGRIFGMTPRQISETLPRLLKFSRLEQFVERPAGKLSGGMKQKLALSSCLMHNPKLLLLDEPGAGVDPVSRREFWQIIKELVDDGIMVVVSTTYMDEAEKCARVIYLKDGRIIVEDSPESLKKQFPLKLFSFKCDILHKFHELLKDSKLFQNVNYFGDEIHASGKVGIDDVEQLVSKIKNFQDCGHVSWQEIKPGLEDVFVYLSETVKHE